MTTPVQLRWQIGDARVTRITEFADITAPISSILDGATPDMVLAQTWLAPDFSDPAGNMIYSVQAFVVEAGGQRIMVDTCVGNDKERTIERYNHLQTDFLERLAAAGFAPDTIDVVLCTHLHLDHVGWNTRLHEGRWVPTFPNARYLFSRQDYAAISAPGHIDWAGDILHDSLQPIVDAGLCDFVDADHVVNDAVRLVPTPGHTPGHASVLIASGSDSAIITGDVMHSPFQCAHPDLHSHFCEDKERATRTRRALLDRCHAENMTLIGSHFAAWTAGRLRPHGDSYRLEEARDQQVP